jgi:hypothetical protein
MKKNKKRYIFIILLFFLLGIVITTIIIYFSHLLKKPMQTQTINVFGAPRARVQHNFPASHPEFAAVIGYIKPASLHQQSITIYKINDSKKIPVFERSFYADGFRGNGLTYTLSSSSPEITQSGSLGTIGCLTNNCILPWSNFYTWSATQNTFVLDNETYKDEFQQLLTTYQSIDQKGCGLIKGTLVSGQDGFSFTQLYKKYPTSKYFCSQNQGILPANLVFFLQAEKAVQEIVSGENIGSDDIREITI